MPRYLYSGVWGRVAKCEMEFERTNVIRSFRVFQQLKSISDIIQFVKESGLNATIEKAGLSGIHLGSCITDHILKFHILEIKSVAELYQLLKSMGMDEYPVVSIRCFENNLRYMMDTLYMGAMIGCDSHESAARFLRAIWLFERETFDREMRDGGKLSEFVKRIFDTTSDRALADTVFRKYGFNLYKLVGEPRPLE